jgi:hypothetical protein
MYADKIEDATRARSVIKEFCEILGVLLRDVKEAIQITRQVPNPEELGEHIQMMDQGLIYIRQYATKWGTLPGDATIGFLTWGLRVWTREFAEWLATDIKSPTIESWKRFDHLQALLEDGMGRGVWGVV